MLISSMFSIWGSTMGERDDGRPLMVMLYSENQPVMPPCLVGLPIVFERGDHPDSVNFDIGHSPPRLETGSLLLTPTPSAKNILHTVPRGSL